MSQRIDASKCGSGDDTTAATARPRAGLIATSGFLLALAMLLSENQELSGRLAAAFALIVAVVSGVIVMRSTLLGQWSMPFLALLVMVIFHCGLFVTPALTGDLPLFLLQNRISWFSFEVLPRLAIAIAIGISAFAFGVAIGGTGRLRAPAVAEVSFTSQGQEDLRRSIAAVGSFVVVGSIVAWALSSVAAAGGAFFLLSYERYLELTKGLPIGLAYMGISLGVPMIAQFVRSKVAAVGLIAFMIFAALGFPLGLRGEVLVPLVAGTGIYMKYSRVRPRWLLLVVSIVVLLGVAIVRQVRSLGVGSLGGSTEVAVNLLDGIEEMGSTARVVALSLTWHEQLGESHGLGETYLAPLLRYWNTIAGQENVLAETDMRLFNVLVGQRAGQVGGSVIGEAHHNFGIIGIVVMLFAWGLLLARLDASDHRPMGLGALGLVSVLFLAHVRDASTHLPIWLTVGTALLALSRGIVGLQRNIKVRTGHVI
ncbi:O-antigen polysaccharide polymerase Wzy [Microbacterium sp.]|uniref:O-antigen polysaccharide polymerase Wzy n=1 Tax=Microbacterium sp. TaxID=51671 RepID=UPI0028A68D87|nr:O-antigen polysaccharide polymerase Wzy [Microbacterium sp.]